MSPFNIQLKLDKMKQKRQKCDGTHTQLRSTVLLSVPYNICKKESDYLFSLP